ncbi:DUF3768 domain-containing protein [Methylocystis hirsuta]|uniref:DUF3768 domain-containing protein n=1 Tax=Methylocystis hirsuta TaxID=369798 RepID=A0A3M9XSY8_9HYPH|nr:DUF3768 domain-containing protein [Methylocystis hirsuta]RNJ51373.1 DUF3768 domain-containing protein [Methylocystis hirsuta]
MPHIDTAARDRIRELNDAFRESFDPKLGRTMQTAGFKGMPGNVRKMALRKTATFDAFTPDNDPNGEHDFGSFEVGGQRFFWKIDCYDPSMESGSEDPTDPEKTTRVLTLMLAEEY